MTTEEVVDMFPTKILLATDGSEEAGRAARLAATLSGKLGSELHVVYVQPLPAPYTLPEAAIVDPDFSERMRQQAAGEALAKLQEEAAKIRSLAEVAGTHARSGRPDAEIVAAAEEIGAGLVVGGSRGLGPIRRAVLGSVSGSVVHHAHGPVLVVREDGRAEGMGPIVLAVDGSEESKLASGAAAEISAATGWPVHMIYVMPSESSLYGRHSYSRDVKRQLMEGARAEARRFLDGRAEGVRAAGGKTAHTYLGVGRPDEEIIELAEEIDAGMVVIGSRGLGGVRRALLGSVSDSVMRHAHCPVLIVRKPERAEAY
jgi:nucleotide-binding universal stress UspA family protein